MKENCNKLINILIRSYYEQVLHYIELALQEATRAAEAGEVPIGALAVFQGEIIAACSNSPISSCDPTAHAEINALRAAAKSLGAYRTPGLELYVTLEPCLMCFGAMLHARVSKLVFGASDPKVGFSKAYSWLKKRVSLTTKSKLNRESLKLSALPS